MNMGGLQRIVGRLVVMVGGEAIQSAFHLGLNVALLHAVSQRDYGIFALVMVIGGVGLTYVRSLTALPACIFIAQSRSMAAANACEVSFGSAATLLAILLGTVVAMVLDSWLTEGASAGGAFIGLWAARSHLRTVFFARNRQKIVSFSDLSFTGCGALGAGLVLVLGTHVLQRTFIVMMLANAMGIIVMLGLAGRPVRLNAGIHVWRRYRSLWRSLKWSLLSVSIANVQGQGMAFLVAAIGGPAAYAPIAAALVMFVPLRIISTAFQNMVHPEISALIARGDRAGLERAFRIWPLALGSLSLVYGAVAMLALPLIQPDQFEHAGFYALATIAWVISMLPLLYGLPRVWLEVQLDFRALALLSSVAALVGLGLTLCILMVTSPSWALFGGAASEAIMLAGLWALVLRRSRVMAVQRAAMPST